MAKKITRILAPAIVIAASIGGYMLLGATKPEPEKSDEPPRPISVHTDTVVKEDIALEVETHGEVRARIQIDLVSQVGGRIVSVSSDFTEGGKFSPGSTLLKIEDTDYRLRLNQAEASVAEAKIGLQQALADANVARKQLRNSPAASPLALKKPQVASAKAALLAADANLEQARLNLERTNVSLPFDGRLISTRVDVGQYVAPGTIIGRAFATDVVEIRLPLNDTQLASLGLPIGYTAAPGEALEVNFSAKVAGQTQRWQGKLVRLDASIDPNTRMLFASAVVNDPYGANVSQHGMPLAVGLYVNAKITGREIGAAHTIPASALRAGNIVFIIDKGLLEMRAVKVLHRSALRAVISEGLSAGEKVIVSPVRNPVRGMALAEITPTEGSEESSEKKPVTNASMTRGH